LKWRQRELVLQQGIDRVIWTYDPLEAPNARLNLAHLGGRVSTYKRDYYGPMEDALNRGLPSDRFVVEWQLDAPWVHERLTAGPSAPVIEGVASTLAVQDGAEGEPAPGPFSPPTGDGPVLVPIPATMQTLRRQDPRLALSWRMATREAFEQLFAAGYVAIGIVRQDGIAYYYLERPTGA
jgi:predicted GNAT superfamily acetyltransferase